MSDMNILIVEDDIITSDNMIYNLNDLGFNDITLARNAKEVEDAIAMNTYDLAILDIELQGSSLNGLQIADKLNLLNEPPKIIFTSSFSDDETINRLKSIPHENYLVKPVSERQIYVAIQDLIKAEADEDRDNYEKIKTLDFDRVLYIKNNNEKYYSRIPVENILYIESGNGGVTFYTTQGKFFSYHSLKNVNERIQSPILFRISKSHIVNITHVIKAAESELVMRDEKILSIGRKYQETYKIFWLDKIIRF